MEDIITILKGLRKLEEKRFVSNSITVYQTMTKDRPIPDTESSLQMIIQFNVAISILENHGMAKNNCDK
jgi:hypothetical protein